ncbi:nucleoside 2-deoxyribosyltransferase [Paucilactobacillus sp. N302-9]
MKHIYLAGPFFSDEQLDRIQKVETALATNPTVSDFFSPRKSDESDDQTEFGSPAWAKRVFKKDVTEIDRADALLVITDFVHENMDSGTAFEVGYAFNQHKPIVLLQELDAPLNLMISQAATYYTKSIADVAQYNFDTLPENEYTGKTF